MKIILENLLIGLVAITAGVAAVTFIPIAVGRLFLWLTKSDDYCNETAWGAGLFVLFALMLAFLVGTCIRH